MSIALRSNGTQVRHEMHQEPRRSPLTKIGAAQETEARHELRGLLRKVGVGDELSHTETSRIKKIYLDLRAEYECVLEDSAEDEVKVLAVRHALDELESMRMSAPEFVSEVIYSVFVLNDKRKRDRMLRSEIAYRMALAAYFYEHVKAIKKMDSSVPATSE